MILGEGPNLRGGGLYGGPIKIAEISIDISICGELRQFRKITHYFLCYFLIPILYSTKQGKKEKLAFRYILII